MNEVKKILKNDLYWNLLLALSGASVGLLILNAYRLDVDKLILQVPMFLSMFIATFFLARFVDVRSKMGSVTKKWQQLTVGYLSLYSLYVVSYQYCKYFFQQYPDEISKVFFIKLGLLALLGVFAVFVAWCLVFWFIKALYKKLSFTRLEKKLILVYTGVCVVLAIFISIFISNNFVLKLNIVDTIYAMDSSAMIADEIHDNNLMAINTDIRHPYAQIFNTPMGVISRIVGQMFHFIPYAQTHAFQLFTIMMIATTGVLVTRLLRLKEKILQMTAFVAYVCLYSTLVFTFAVEMYVPSVLFLVLFVYSVTRRWSFRWNVFFLVISTGYIITSAVAGILLVLRKGDTIRQRAVKGFAALGIFLVSGLVFGKLLTLLHAKSATGVVHSFSGDTGIVEKLHQFTNFIATTLTAGYHEVFYDGMFYKYRTAEIAIHQINPVGIIILVLVLFGVWAGRKHAITWITAGWAAVAFGICVIIGWGSVLNEMALYSFYFGWAYFILAFIGVKWVIGIIVKGDIVRRWTLAVTCLILSVVNLVAFGDIIRFAHAYYPPVPVKEIIQEVLPYEQETK